MKKGKSSFGQAVSWTLFFVLWNAHVAQQHIMCSKKVVASPGRALLHKEILLMISALFCGYLLPLFFSWLIQTFLGGGITRQDKKSAILYLGTWSSVLRFYASEMNCSEPLVSSVIESCIYFAIDDFVVVGLFLFSLCRGDLKEEQCYLF